MLICKPYLYVNFRKCRAKDPQSGVWGVIRIGTVESQNARSVPERRS